ncbi:MAG: YjcZ family sporulation protein [Erysipelotrichaceae bacterium]|nr:YjcZ family sporulation protein [Erysipelotrichaceae bacterium]
MNTGACGTGCQQFAGNGYGNNGFLLILVLFILLAIIGAAWF